jgi:hypothetical protein
VIKRTRLIEVIEDLEVKNVLSVCCSEPLLRPIKQGPRFPWFCDKCGQTVTSDEVTSEQESLAFLELAPLR